MEAKLDYGMERKYNLGPGTRTNYTLKERSLEGEAGKETVEWTTNN